MEKQDFINMLYDAGVRTAVIEWGSTSSVGYGVACLRVTGKRGGVPFDFTFTNKDFTEAKL